MNRWALKALLSAAMLMGIPAFADPVASDWCVNLNGNVDACAFGGPGNAAVDLSQFNQGTGLGRITVSLGAGVGQFVSIYLDLDLTSAFATDYASLGGALPSNYAYRLRAPLDGQFNAFTSNVLDNSNTVDTPTGPPNSCCDVSVVLAVNALDVDPGGTGTVVFDIGTTAPSGFYIRQASDSSTQALPVYFSATYQIDNPVPTGEVPEPSAWILFSTLLGGTAFLQHRRKSAKV